MQLSTQTNLSTCDGNMQVHLRKIYVVLDALTGPWSSFCSFWLPTHYRVQKHA